MCRTDESVTRTVVDGRGGCGWNGGENEYIEPKLGAARGRAKKEGKGGTEVKAKRTDRAAAAEAVVTVQNIFSLSKKRVGPDQNRFFFLLIKNWRKYIIILCS